MGLPLNATLSGVWQLRLACTLTCLSVGTPATYGILVKNSDIEGNIENTNEIFGSGHFVVGLGIVNDGQYEIGGSLTSSRVISVNGEQSIALKLAGADVKGGISNSGLLYASGSGARSVVLQDSKFGPLVNSGVINAVGAQGIPDRGVTTIYVDNVQGYDDGNLGTAVVQNTSTISSSGVGIVNTGASDLVINNSGRGTILGTIAAIDGGDHTTLNLGGGSVTGDILGLSQLNVLEDRSSIVTAKNIEANSMNIGKNARLYLRTSQSSLKGDLRLAGGSAMDLMLANDTDPNTAYLDVSGTATFDAGSAVTVSAKPYDFTPTKEGVEYVLVEAGSIADSGVAVSSSSYLLNVEQFAVDGTTLKAVVQAKTDDEIGDIEDPDGGTPGGDNGGEGDGSPHGHGLKLLGIVAVLCHVVMQDQAVFSVHGGLYVISHPRAFGRAHHSGIAFAGVELLDPHRLHQRLAGQVVQLPGFKLLQRCLDGAAVNGFTRFGCIGLIQFGQILGDAFIQFFLLALELFHVQMAPLRGYRLKFTAINGNQVASNQTDCTAELHEGPTRCTERLFVVLAKVGNGLEIWFEAVE